MQTVKVSSHISSDLHSDVSRLAEQNQTTIGAVVNYGVGLAVRELKRNPRAAKRLAKDNRIKAGKD
jgi:hypothetical protein